MPPVRSVSSSTAKTDLHAAPTGTEVTLLLPETDHHRRVDRRVGRETTCTKLFLMRSLKHRRVVFGSIAPLYRAVVKRAEHGEQVVKVLLTDLDQYSCEGR